MTSHFICQRPTTTALNIWPLLPGRRLRLHLIPGLEVGTSYPTRLAPPLHSGVNQPSEIIQDLVHSFSEPNYIIRLKPALAAWIQASYSTDFRYTGRAVGRQAAHQEPTRTRLTTGLTH